MGAVVQWFAGKARTGPMFRMQLTRHEVLLLGALALLTVLLVFVPWKELVLKYREYEASKFAAVRASREAAKAPPKHPDWQVKTEYSPATGALRLTLSHKHIKPSPDLTVTARFSSGNGVSPVARTFLQNHSGGVYGADNLNLPKGEWVMSLTGRRNLEFLFRREEILKVE